MIKTISEVKELFVERFDVKDGQPSLGPDKVKISKFVLTGTERLHCWDLEIANYSYTLTLFGKKYLPDKALIDLVMQDGITSIIKMEKEFR